jgi:shikimate kinase
MGIILLTGPKHSGKTSAGRALASPGGAFVDLDEFIEERTGKNPRALYREGAGVFRKAEAEALRTLLGKQAAEPAEGVLIIAAGGGIIDNAEAAAVIEKQAGLVIVYLDVSPETAWERIRRGGELPPFLDTPHPEETHRQLHRRRAEAYRKLASITIDAGGKSPAVIAAEIRAKRL